MSRTHHLVRTLADLEAAKAALESAPFLALDTETTGLDVHAPEFQLVGVSVAGCADAAYYLPVHHEEFCLELSYQTPNLSIGAVRDFVVWCYQKNVVLHNAAYDRPVFKRTLQLDFEQTFGNDTKLALHKLDENGRQSLKERAKQFLGVEENRLKYSDVKQVLERFWLDELVTTEKVEALSEKTGRRYKKNLYALTDTWLDDVLRDWRYRTTGAESISYVFDYWRNFFSVLRRRSIVSYEGALPKDFRFIPTEVAAVYAGDDTINTWALWAKAAPSLKSQALADVYRLDRSVDDTMMRASYEGIQVDVPELERMQGVLSERLGEAERTALAVATDILPLEAFIDGDFNGETLLNSTKQLQALLFDELGFAPVEMTAIGNPSTNAKTLKELLTQTPRKRPEMAPQAHAFIRAKRQIADISKIKSTYTEGLAKLVDTHGTIHPSFNVTGTVSGRMSSNSPNFQNMPRLLPEEIELKPWLAGIDIRKALKAPEGWVFVDFDYISMELVMCAGLSGDKTMQGLLNDGRDLHSYVARQAFNVGHTLDDAQFKKEYKLYRNKAKIVSFALIYGGSSWTLIKNFGFTETEAEELIAAYFRTFPAVKEWMDSVYAALKRDGYVTYPEFGFVKRMDVTSWKTYEEKRQFNACLRSCQNALIQGTSAFIVKAAINAISQQLRARALKSFVSFQIHDEIGCLAPESEAAEVYDIMKACMERDFAGVFLGAEGELVRTMSKSAKALELDFYMDEEAD